MKLLLSPFKAPITMIVFQIRQFRLISDKLKDIIHAVNSHRSDRNWGAPSGCPLICCWFVGVSSKGCGLGRRPPETRRVDFLDHRSPFLDPVDVFVQDVLLLQDDMFSFPIFHHAERLERRNDIVRVYRHLLTDIFD
jgi:hypothetical protein